MNDKELLELAANAAEYGEVWYLEGHDTPYVGQKFKLGEPIGYHTFNPLTDDGDALRLAVKLGLQVMRHYFEGDYFVDVTWDAMAAKKSEPLKGDPYAATRRAIVRAAAEIGKAHD